MKVMWMVPLMVAAGCDLTPADPAVAPEPEPEILNLRLEADCGTDREVRHVDFFVFGSGGVCPLEFHERVEESCVCNAAFTAYDGDKTVVCIVDCPFPFNTDALTRYEAIESLSLLLEDEDPEAPVLTGTAALYAEAGVRGQARIAVTPLLCRIEVTRIVNEIGGYTLVEDPVLYLQDINTEAELLRTVGFRQKETGLCTERVPLAHDIGASGIAPHALFSVYPNDSREIGAGTPATAIVLEGTVRGERRNYRVALPPFGRGARIHAALTLEAEGVTAAFN